MNLLQIRKDGSIDSILEMTDTAKNTCQMLVDMYERQTFILPWIGYIAEKDGELVGMCAFKSEPSNGKVEIAYFTFPEFERRGIATEMVRELVEIANNENAKVIVSAQTLPEENASTSVLKKLGFCKSAEFKHPVDGLVWEWIL